MKDLDVVTLHGTRVSLEPLSLEHLDGLKEAAADGELWHLWYTSVPRPEGMHAEIERRLAKRDAGTMVPFTTRLNNSDGTPGKIIGMTSFYDIDLSVPRLSIGFTWNAASTHGSGTNPDAKRLLLAHAFETIGCACVAFEAHWMNEQSRTAIARLGAKQDGVLRAHKRMPDGLLRDTVVFSILENEWPMVRNGLDLRLAKQRS